MANSLGATTSIIAHRLLDRKSTCKDSSYKTQPSSSSSSRFMGRRLIISSDSNPATRQVSNRSTGVRSLAMDLAREVHSFKEDRIPHDLDYHINVGLTPRRLWPPANKADDPSIHNPLLRQERMGPGWLAVIFEFEGVIVDDDPNLERESWLVLSREEVRPPPPTFMLNRIEGMKNEQAISEVLCWSRDPPELRRLSARKEEIHQSLHGGFYQTRPGSKEFVAALVNHKIPIAIASTRPRGRLLKAVGASGVEGFLTAIVAAEDVQRGKPDPEMFEYAARLLGFVPERCIVFGNSNSAVEAAHDARMKCVAVASKHPVYELSAADMVVQRLDEISIVDLKNLADVDLPEFEMEEEEEELPRPSSVTTDDLFW